jgi:DNA replication ATP-dependent helicase Dna2
LLLALWQVVTGMLLAGVKPEAVAVISPLRAQLKLLRREMGHLRRVEVNTVDKYQGSDRDCIILSLVRSNSEGKIGELLRDRRRINVAVSRAKRKLILVGSKRTLMQGEVFKDLIGHLSSRGWILDLPPGGHELYQEKDVDVLCEVAWTDSPK